jgi:hydroxylamine reductase (hybrid-cluster protein)
MSKGFTTEQIIKAMEGTNGNISLIAVNLNCSWATARKYISDNVQLRTIYKGENERMLDKAENIISQALENDDDKKTQLETAKWLLATKGYSRGYNSKNKKYEYRNALAPYTDFKIGDDDPDD